MKMYKTVRGVLIWGILGLMIMNGTAIGSILTMSTDVPKSIPDGSPGGVTSTLDFPSMNIQDVDLILTITHTCIIDLHIELTSPAGTTANLISGEIDGILPRGCHENLVDTHFDDEALTNLRDGLVPYTGHFNIDWEGNDNMSFFDGQNAGGTWTLFVSDLLEDDKGTLQGWGLEIVPEPATMVLLGLGTLMLGKRRA